jgi:hypothetical protein
VKCEHIAEVFNAVSEIFGARANFSAELGRCKPIRRPSIAWPPRLEVAAGEMLYLDDDAAYVAGAARPDCRRNG